MDQGEGWRARPCSGSGPGDRGKQGCQGLRRRQGRSGAGSMDSRTGVSSGAGSVGSRTGAGLATLLLLDLCMLFRDREASLSSEDVTLESSGALQWAQIGMTSLNCG